MIHLDHILEATSGVLLYTGKQNHFDAFCHDTRQLIPGEMFVAVCGEQGDGHDYLLDAIQRGAAGLLVETHIMESLPQDTRTSLERAGVATIAVADTRIALQNYASFILRLWHPTIIAVTGSTGKTSTKEAIAAVLASNFATFKSWQNYNDLLGLPLSLGRLEDRHEFAVLELSCDHPGEISDLCRITRPDIGVLTNISPTQLQFFGTVERLAAELGTLLAALPVDGLAIVNGDDELIRSLTAACVASVTPFTPSTVREVQVGWTVSCVLPETCEGTNTERQVPLSSRLIGRHFVTTILAAYYVGRHCGLKDEEIQHALAPLHSLPGRLHTLPGLYSTTLLDDTHNASPASMIAGLEALRELPTDYRIAVLGDMLRLGNYEEEAHRAVGRKAAACVDYLITRGERAALIAEAAQEAGLATERVIVTSTHEDAAKAARAIMNLPGENSCHTESHTKAIVLIKGSEETRMERVTEMIMAEPAHAPELLARQTPGWKQIVVMRADRPTWVEIDLSAIANNTRQIKALLGPRVRILASLKADAYGHGVVKVARTVLHNGASMLGVATVSEARPLREAGIAAPILVFGYVPPWQMREAVRLDLAVTLYSVESAQALSRAALALKQSAKVHIKIDTGMGRLGIRAEQVDEVLALVREILALPGLEMEGIFTHFALADTQDQAHMYLQLARFREVVGTLEELGLRPPLVHAANSAALLSLPESHFDMVRPGIALYGLDPSEEVPIPESFRPALSFKTQVSQVKVIPAGECISYGCTYVTETPTRVAALPVGYADGFRRAPTNWGSVLLHGQAAPILGRVCMDQCIIDVTHIPQTRVGDEVVLIGRQGQASLTAEIVAQRLGTSNYEVVSAILARVPRVD
ncbi:MAG: alanine racemase [Chloroflexi bacterium]|nr:MAG: alanine racemase [Chloroflexota bacterium]